MYTQSSSVGRGSVSQQIADECNRLALGQMSRRRLSKLIAPGVRGARKASVAASEKRSEMQFDRRDGRALLHGVLAVAGIAAAYVVISSGLQSRPAAAPAVADNTEATVRCAAPILPLQRGADPRPAVVQPIRSSNVPAGASGQPAVHSPFRPPLAGAGNPQAAGAPGKLSAINGWMQSLTAETTRRPAVALPLSDAQRKTIVKALRKAQHLRQQGKPEEAAAAEEEALQQSPKDFNLRQVCIRAYRRLGNTWKLKQLYIEGINLAQSKFERELYQVALDQLP